MKNIFLFILGALIAFSQFVSWKTAPDGSTSNLPVVYWVTDTNPIRPVQVAQFRAWLKAKGFPDVDLRIDVNNRNPQKMVLQGVAGVAGDLLEDYPYHYHYLDAIGIIEPIADLEARFGYPDSDRFPALLNELTNEKGQIAFPADFRVTAYLVNVDAFKRAGMKAPPITLQIDEFEKMGVEYVARANAGSRRREYFFASSVDLDGMRRSGGWSPFNETMTGSAVRHPAALRTFQRLKRWTEELHLLPSSAEAESMVVGGAGEANVQLLHRGTYAMSLALPMAMATTRAMAGSPTWSAMVTPYEKIPYGPATARSVLVYKGSRNKEAVRHFLAFLRSDEYNLSVVKDCVDMPPSRRYMTHPDLLRPAAWTNEWEMHERFSKISLDHSWPRDFSPYALFENYGRSFGKASQAFTSGVITAEEAVAQMHNGVETEIARFMKTHPELQAAFDEGRARQKKIDEAKAAGKKVPLALVNNPFLKKWYTVTGEGE